MNEERKPDSLALERAYREALGEPPPRLLDDACGDILAATTRKRPIAEPRAGRRLALAGALAAAGLAALAVLKRPEASVPDEETLELAGLDLDLMDDLELARELEVLELLDALEEVEDG